MGRRKSIGGLDRTPRWQRPVRLPLSPQGQTVQQPGLYEAAFRCGRAAAVLVADRWMVRAGQPTHDWLAGSPAIGPSTGSGQTVVPAGQRRLPAARRSNQNHANSPSLSRQAGESRGLPHSADAGQRRRRVRGRCSHVRMPGRCWRVVRGHRQPGLARVGGGGYAPLLLAAARPRCSSTMRMKPATPTGGNASLPAGAHQLAGLQAVPALPTSSMLG